MMTIVIGAVDEIESGESLAIDFLFSIDASGSMGITREIIRDVICDWSIQDLFQDSRFAIIVFGVFDNNVGNDNIELVADFADAQTTCSLFTVYLTNLLGGSREFQPDSVIRSFLEGDLLLNWEFGTNRRKTIIFSDEPLQSQYLYPEQVLIESCNEHNYSVSAFIPSNIMDYNKWQLITQRCSGFLEQLSTNPDDMIEKLNYYIGLEQC